MSCGRGIFRAERRTELAVDGRRGLAGDLLVDDRLQQRGERPESGSRAEAAGAHRVDDARQHGIDARAGGPPRRGACPRRARRACRHGGSRPHAAEATIARHGGSRRAHPGVGQGRAAPARGRLHPRRGHLGADAPLPAEPGGHPRRDAAAAGAPGRARRARSSPTSTRCTTRCGSRSSTRTSAGSRRRSWTRRRRRE